MRIAIVEILGHIISYLDNDTDLDPKKTSKDIENLFTKLIARQLDVSSYVRVKVFNVLRRLCDITPERRPTLAATDAASGALSDKVASVRKSAIALLSKLIEEHSYWRAFRQRKTDLKLDLDLNWWEKSHGHFKREREAMELEVQRLIATSDGQRGGDDGSQGDQSDLTQAKQTNR